MNLINSKQSQYQAQHPISCHHRPHLHHYRHHQTQEQKPPRHTRFLSLLLSPSSATIVSILIISSVWSLPSCCALVSVLPDGGSEDTISSSSSSTTGDSFSVLATTIGSHSKRTILPFHFKLLQDYLHKHGTGSDTTGADNAMRYPVEMLIPPGIRIAPDSGSHGLWWRSRRSAPLDEIAVSLRSKSYPRIDLGKVSDTNKMSDPYSPFSYGELAIDDIDYFEPARITDDVFLEAKMNNEPKLSKFKPKSFTNNGKNTPSPSMRRYLKKMRQKQKIIDALRRRDKAKQLAASRKSRISSEMLLPPLSEAVIRAFQDLQAMKSEKYFVKKHKGKSQKNVIPTPIFFEEDELQPHEGFKGDPFGPTLNQGKGSYKKAVGERDGFLNELKSAEPGVYLDQVDWFVSAPDVGEPSALLAASTIEDSLSSGPGKSQDTVVFEDGFGKDAGFSGLGDFSSSPVVGQDLGSTSALGSFSHTGTFGAPSPYSGEAAFVSSTFGSGPADGFGDLWGQGEFVSDDKDCADIETKTCETNTDCSCYGFYQCSHNRRCEALSASQQQATSDGIWHDGPLGFSLSKRHAIQRGNSIIEPDPKMAVSRIKKSGSRRR